MAESLRLFGTRAIVTGAIDGIGEAIVRTFVKQGAAVFAVDSRDSGIETHYSALRGVTPQAANPIEKDAPRGIVAAAVKAMGGLDVVVNNVATQGKVPMSEVPAVDAFMKDKLRVYAAFAEAAVPHLEKSPAGRIVNIGCLRSAFAQEAAELHARSRDALDKFTADLAARVGPDGVTVNYIHPGAIMTPASRRVFADSKELRDFCIRRSAAGRLGEPVDIAKVALFLASDDAVFVSGTGIVVDGGAR